MKEYLIKLRFKIDRISLRERIIILAGILASVTILWLFVFYYPQKGVLEQTRQVLDAEQTAIATLVQKRQSIENIAKDDTVIKLLNKFERLKVDMQQLQNKVVRYDQRFISEQELAKLLYSMLEQTRGVTIQNFSNVDFIQSTLPETLAAQAPVSSATSTPTSGQTSPPNAELAPNKPEKAPGQRVQYMLTLEGDYFSIMAYLERLEQLPWQLYWDKMDYQVKNYPQAVVVVYFYTLKPSEQSTSSSGVAK